MSKDLLFLLFLLLFLLLIPAVGTIAKLDTVKPYTLYTLQCIVYIKQCIVCSAFYGLQITVYSVLHNYRALVTNIRCVTC